MITIFNGRQRTLGGATSNIHVQISVDFRKYLHLLRGARLAVFLAIALHADRHGWARPSRALLQRETGYNTDTISKALSDLCTVVIEDHRILLRHQPQAHDGTYTPNHYLIFPSPHEIAQFEGRQLELSPCSGLPCTVEPCTVEPCTVRPCTVEPYTVNHYTKDNHLKVEPRKEEIPPKEEPAAEVEATAAPADTDREEILSALAKAGIGEPTRSRLAQLPHVTTEYIHAHTAKARTDEIDIPLLIHRIMSNDPQPDICPQCGGINGSHNNDCSRRYRKGFCPSCHTYAGEDLCPNCDRCYNCCKCREAK